MNKPKVGFIVYGVHKDGLCDPMGAPFIDDAIVKHAKKALKEAGLQLVEYPTVIASKPEARACLSSFKKREDVDALVLFSGTWVWSAHLVAPLRDYAATGRGIVLWTHPGSQGWRPVGGLVMHGALKEVGIPHRFVYGGAGVPAEVARIVSYCRASWMRQRLNMSTIGVFGGRGMGQTCGVADPSQWMRVFGVDIDSRDTTALLETAKAVSKAELARARKQIQKSFSQPIPRGATADRSIALYLAIRKILAQEQWDFYTIQSFPGLGDDFSATCFAQSLILNDGIGTSTLSDFNTAMTVKLLTDLSVEPVYYGDRSTSTSRTTRSRSSATAPVRRGWRANSGRPDSPSMAFPRKAKPAAFQCNCSASPARACWRASAATTANSNSWCAAPRSSSRPPTGSRRASSSAASRSGRTLLCARNATLSACWKPGTTNTPASDTARTSTTNWSRSASRLESGSSRCDTRDVPVRSLGELDCLPGDGARLSRLRYDGVDLLTRAPGALPPSRDYGRYEERPVYGYDDCFPSVVACRYPDKDWNVPDHGELCWLPWAVEAGADILNCAVESRVLPVAFRRTMQFSPDAIAWRFEVSNRGTQALAFQHVMHPLMPLRDVVGIGLPIFMSAVDEMRGAALADGEARDAGAYLLARPAGTATMLLLRGIETGQMRVRFRSGHAVTILFPRRLFDTIGIWWNRDGYPDEEGCRRNECAFEPIPGAGSDLAEARRKGGALTVAPGQSCNWSVRWEMTRDAAS